MDMSKVNGGQIVAKCLKMEGVDTVFAITGEHVQSIFYGCCDEGIKVVDCRHEGGAVAAAEGYAKSTGKPGVVIATAGPGVANTVSGMLEAKDNGSPVVLLGGAVPTVEKGTGTLQDSPTLQIMGHCAKWAQKVDHTFRIADHVATAFRHATSGAPGPAYLEIPYDI